MDVCPSLCRLRSNDILSKQTNDPYHFKEKIDKKYLQIDEIQKKINSGKDIIGRNEVYKAKKIDKSFPKPILENLEKYKDWISN